MSDHPTYPQVDRRAHNSEHRPSKECEARIAAINSHLHGDLTLVKQKE